MSFVFRSTISEVFEKLCKRMENSLITYLKFQMPEIMCCPTILCIRFRYCFTNNNFWSQALKSKISSKYLYFSRKNFNGLRFWFIFGSNFTSEILINFEQNGSCDQKMLLLKYIKVYIILFLL